MTRVVTEKIKVELQDVERNFEFMDFKNSHWAISSFYEVVDSSTCEKIVGKLVDRISHVMRLNPWLMSYGKHARKEGACFGLVKFIEYDPSDDPAKFINTVTDDKIFGVSDYVTLLKTMKPYTLNQLPMSPYATAIPLVRVSIIKSSANDKLCLFLGWNHVIGDGGTFFTIYKMFDEKETAFSMRHLPKSFDVESRLKSETSILPTTAKTRSDDYKQFESAFTGPMLKLHLKNAFARVKQNAAIHILDAKQIEAVKAKFKTAESYVSTNDIVGCEIYSMLGKYCTSLFVPASMRGRVSGVDRDHAGNMLSPFLIYDKDLSTPMDMRNRVNALMKPGYDWKLTNPGGAPMVFHDSWTAFHHNLEPDGLRLQKIVPVFALDDMPAFFLTYKMNARDTALLAVLQLPGITQNTVSASNIIGDKVM